MDALERLTEKSRLLVTELSVISSLTVRDLLLALEKSDGMGKYILDIFRSARLKKTAPIVLNKIIESAYVLAHKLKHPYVGTEHIYLALLEKYDKLTFTDAFLEMQKLSPFPMSEKPMDISSSPFLSTFGEDLNKKILFEK